MKLIDTRPVPLAEIFDRNRLRPIDPAWADALAQQILETGGLRTPIEVRALKPSGFALIAGGHRLAAAKLLGWDSIQAQIYEASADEARLREVDENLIRHELNPLDRGAFLLERKALYLKMYPATAQHVIGGHAKANKVSASEIVSFAADTAEKLGLTSRTIELAISIAANLSPESKARVAGTPLARNQADLLALAKLGPKEQAAALDAYFGRDDFKNLRAAIATLGDRPAREPDHAAKLVTAWMHADKAAKIAFLRFICREAVGLGWRLEEIPAPKADATGQATPETATEEDVAAARVDGYGAYQDEAPRTDNPYGGATRRDQQLAAAWLEGWDEAAAEDGEDGEDSAAA